MAIQPFKIEEYIDRYGNSPFREWVETLSSSVKARIQARVLRFEGGNLGDYKSVGAGVLEARFDFGPGYRLYFALRGKALALLLIGGDKASQRKDIERAKDYLRDYLENETHV
jgi:putative addiction module killer protein